MRTVEVLAKALEVAAYILICPADKKQPLANLRAGRKQRKR
jgi:hypothetical protein